MGSERYTETLKGILSEQLSEQSRDNTRRAALSFGGLMLCSAIFGISSFGLIPATFVFATSIAAAVGIGFCGLGLTQKIGQERAIKTVTDNITSPTLPLIITAEKEKSEKQSKKLSLANMGATLAFLTAAGAAIATGGGSSVAILAQVALTCVMCVTVCRQQFTQQKVKSYDRLLKTTQDAIKQAILTAPKADVSAVPAASLPAPAQPAFQTAATPAQATAPQQNQKQEHKPVIFPYY